MDWQLERDVAHWVRGFPRELFSARAGARYPRVARAILSGRFRVDQPHG